MQKLLVLAVVMASLVSAASAKIYEPFNYTVGQTLLGQTNPSNGQTYAQAGPSGRTNVNLIASGNLTPPPELQPAVGNSLTIKGIGSTASNGTSDRLAVGTVTSGSVYYSFTMRVDELTGSNNTIGGFFVGLNNSVGAQSGTVGTVGARIQSRIDPGDATKYDLGIFNNHAATSGAASWSSALSVASTIFVVAAYTFNTGSATDDVSALWINPGSLGAGSAPAPTLSDTTGGTDLTAIASIVLRQSPAPYLTMDELRIGSSWLDVTPEPASLLLLASATPLFWRRRRR